MLQYDDPNYMLPEYMLGGLKRYFENRIPPGDFLMAVLQNDLRGSCMRADSVNRYKLFDYLNWLYNEAPMGSWGSPENVKNWLKGGPIESAAEPEQG